MPETVTYVLGLISAVSLYFAHDYAHQVYGVSETTLGSVGLAISAFAFVGIVLNAYGYESVMGDD